MSGSVISWDIRRRYKTGNFTIAAWICSTAICLLQMNTIWDFTLPERQYNFGPNIHIFPIKKEQVIFKSTEREHLSYLLQKSLITWKDTIIRMTWFWIISHLNPIKSCRLLIQLINVTELLVWDKSVTFPAWRKQKWMLYWRKWSIHFCLTK